MPNPIKLTKGATNSVAPFVNSIVVLWPLPAAACRAAVGAFVAGAGANHQAAAVGAGRGVALDLHQLLHHVAGVGRTRSGFRRVMAAVIHRKAA
jgi:hypothetical protein